MADVECFYFAHQFRTMQIGGRVVGARALVRKLRAIAAEYPNAALVKLCSVSDPPEDPLRGVAFLPHVAVPDSPRDLEWLKRHPRNAA